MLKAMYRLEQLNFPKLSPGIFGHGLCLYEGDGGGEKEGGAGASGEKEGEGKEGKEGEGKEGSTGDTDKDATFEVNVGGKTVHMTMVELTAAASKAAGADAKFEEAASQRKAGADGIRLQELGTKLNAGTHTEADLKEFAVLMGGDAEAMIKTVKAAGPDKKTGDKKDKEVALVDMENLSPRVKAAMEAAEQQDISRIRQKIELDVKLGVDKDPVLSKMVSEAPSESQESLKNTLFDMAMERVRGRILGNESFGPGMISDTVQNVRSQIKNLGILSKATGQPAVLGLGPAMMGIEPEVLAKEPIKRVASTDDGYETNAVHRIQQEMIKKSVADSASGR